MPRSFKLSSPAQANQVIRSRDKAPVSNVQTWGGVEFVRIPAGKFFMGSKDDNPIGL